jgi:hypothetical protein
MKHNVEEFYKINGQKFYTMDYIIANDIPKCKRGDRNHGYSVAMYLGTSKDAVNVHTANGVVVMYAFGEKTLFDTREERDAYRIQYTKDREAMVSKNKVIKAITAKLNEMDEENLRKLLATLEAC